MAPSTTQMLVDLGVGEKVVGIDSYSASFADSLPSDVKQFDMTAPDCETIAALKPDIVFVSELSSSGGPDVFAPLEKAGICVATIPSSSSLSGIEDDIRFVGACTGEAAKAEVLAAGLDTVAGQVKNVTSAITGDDKKSVLFMMSVPTSDAPAIYSFGSGTYMSEILEDIGAVNVCADQQGWVSLTEEDAVAMNPDVILTNVNYLGSDPVTAIESMAGWENVTAIKNKAVYYVDADACSRPNEHVGEAMIEWAAKIYPDIVKKAGLTNTLEKAEAAVSPATEK
jgi:iron complex transport system substrate-binding protein